MELLRNFFQAKNLFNPAPIYSPASLQTMLVIFCCCAVVGLIGYFIWRFSKNRGFLSKILLRKFQKFFLAMGLVGLGYTGLCYARAAYLSSRFVLLLIIIGALVWLGYLLYFSFYQAPYLKQQEEKRQRIEKYLPKRKKRKN